MIIAIDGPAASGKGTISKGLAKHYSLPHLDSGLLYRAVGLALIEQLEAPQLADLAEDVAKNLDVHHLDEKILGAPDVAMAAARVARIPRVRAALFQVQRDFAMQPGGAVLDGRDMGSRICPEADAKLFISADPEVRAHRRVLQLGLEGAPAQQEEILAQILARDESDKENPAGAFFPAKDALLLDSSQLDIETALKEAIALVEQAVAQGMN